MALRKFSSYFFISLQPFFNVKFMISFQEPPFIISAYILIVSSSFTSLLRGFRLSDMGVPWQTWASACCSVAALVAAALAASPHIDSSIEYCRDMQPQRSLDLDQLMGLWHTVEIIQHRDEQRLRGIQVTDTCPMVHLSQISTSDLKMLWHEPAGYVEYRFRITDDTNPGFWLSWGPQNGSMLSKPYQQFAGTVQVMKAVQTHMVLTFCSPNQSHYTIILARNNHLSMTDIRGVRNLLNRRGLPQIGIRETCKDSASLAGPTVVLVLLSAVVVMLSY